MPRKQSKRGKKRALDSEAPSTPRLSQRPRVGAPISGSRKDAGETLPLPACAVKRSLIHGKGPAVGGQLAGMHSRGGKGAKMPEKVRASASRMGKGKIRSVKEKERAVRGRKKQKKAEKQKGPSVMPAIGRIARKKRGIAEFPPSPFVNGKRSFLLPSKEHIIKTAEIVMRKQLAANDSCGREQRLSAANALRKMHSVIKSHIAFCSVAWL